MIVERFCRDFEKTHALRVEAAKKYFTGTKKSLFPSIPSLFTFWISSLEKSVVEMAFQKLAVAMASGSGGSIPDTASTLGGLGRIPLYGRWVRSSVFCFTIMFDGHFHY